MKTTMSTPASARHKENPNVLYGMPLPKEARPTATEKALQVIHLWGDTLLNVKNFGDNTSVTIGEINMNDFITFFPTLGTTFTLAKPGDASTAILRVPHEAALTINTPSGSPQSKEQLKSEGKFRYTSQADEIDLGLHDNARLDLNQNAFIIRYVRPSTITPARTHDFTFFKIISITFLAFIALLVAMIIMPQFRAGVDDIFSRPSKYVKMVVRPEKKHEIVKVKDFAELQKKLISQEKIEKKKDKKDNSNKKSAAKDRKREKDRKKVSSLLSGMFGGSASSSVFGAAGLGTGINTALGGLKGNVGAGSAQGIAGLGARGAGIGGGSGGLGIGGVGLGGGGGGGGYGSINLGGRGKATTRVIPGRTTVIGGLSKAVIMKVIRRHQNEIKFCYERELQKNPSLAGKVAVAWTIDPTGSVSVANVSESSVGNANVESCIVRRIRRWKFPEPLGGGIVNVTFPWIFKVAGVE